MSAQVVKSTGISKSHQLKLVASCDIISAIPAPKVKTMWRFLFIHSKITAHLFVEPNQSYRVLRSRSTAAMASQAAGPLLAPAMRGQSGKFGVVC